MPYIPPIFLRRKKASPGQFKSSSGEDFQGDYIETESGLSFIGTSLSQKLTPLAPIPERETELEGQIPKINTPVPYYPKVTLQDQQAGVFSRYFVFNKNNLQIVEVSKEGYDSFSGVPPYRTAEILWVVSDPSGNYETTTKFGLYEFKGAIEKNRDTISQLEESIPGISLLLNPAQYVKRPEPKKKTPSVPFFSRTSQRKNSGSGFSI